VLGRGACLCLGTWVLLRALAAVQAAPLLECWRLSEAEATTPPETLGAKEKPAARYSSAPQAIAEAGRFRRGRREGNDGDTQVMPAGGQSPGPCSGGARGSCRRRCARRSIFRGHWKVVRIKQHASFTIYSASVAADEVERLVGLQPDRVSVRGSRTASPPRPLEHAWKVLCDERGLTVEEQVDRIVARLSPYRPAIRKVVNEIDEVHAVLGVVRYFGAWLADGDGEEEDLAIGPDGWEKLPGQHQLLGWHLPREVMEFLLDLGAEMDFDEYG